ncbi:MAG TPA: SMP-30/gluconolactonase/LRE family protein [Nocardioidaceae bacterium]|nr:SMP-30/gluconolactonase/LRE family protein [Nocardioidaceae bacterium]
MNKPLIAALALALPLGLVAAPAQADDDHDDDHPRPSSYVLDGDPTDEFGSKFEGIGVTRSQKTFYVSEVTGGEIHRGDVRTGETEVWKDEGADGRTTARGITTDRQGRVYIAGGPNGIGNDQPDLWVYSRHGELLAAIQLDVDDAFLNDVAIGPDGAAYFTNSNEPQIFRVAKEHGTWSATLWADAGDTIDVEIESGGIFNLGGIVVSPGRGALIVAQGNTGQLWRFDLRTTEATPIDIGEADLTNADGLVLRGHTLWVVRNFAHVLTTMRISHRTSVARLISERMTDPDRVFTTAKIARGRLLLVDSKFDEQVAEPPYEVVAMKLRP